MGRVHDSPCFLKVSCVLLQASIPESVRNVLSLLQYRGNGRGGQCSPRIRAIADDLGLSERSVKRAIASLRDMGLITVTNHGQAGLAYVVKPEKEWGKLMEEWCQNVTIRRASNSAKMSPLKVPKVHYSASVSINEKNKRRTEDLVEGVEGERTLFRQSPGTVRTNGTAPPSPPCASRERQPRALALSDPERESAWDTVVKVMDGCGRPVANGKLQVCRKEFFKYPLEEQQRIATDACIRAREFWNEPKWTPELLAHLKSRDWDLHPVKERTLPRKRVLTAREEKDLRMANWAATGKWS